MSILKEQLECLKELHFIANFFCSWGANSDNNLIPFQLQDCFTTDTANRIGKQIIETLGLPAEFDFEEFGLRLDEVYQILSSNYITSSNYFSQTEFFNYLEFKYPNEFKK